MVQLGNFPNLVGCRTGAVCPILACRCYTQSLADLETCAMTDVTPPFEGHRAQKLPAISFEFFPPKSEEMERALWDAIERLAPLKPNFVSVTYGAGGSTRERTHSTIARILKETALLPAAHLTRVGAARAEIDEIADRYHEVGVRHIVARRGDPATGIGTAHGAHPDGYQTSPA